MLLEPEASEVDHEPNGKAGMSNRCFVFGSNVAGVHGAGAALTAYRKYGAIWGIGYGRMGDSFAIPTKNTHIVSLDLGTIQWYVSQFIEYASTHPADTYQVTCIGCGLAGNKHKEIAPMFKNAPMNCEFDEAWAFYLPHHKLWGNY